MSYMTLSDEEMVAWANASIERNTELEAALEAANKRIAELTHDFNLATQLRDEAVSELYKEQAENELLRAVAAAAKNQQRVDSRFVSVELEQALAKLEHDV